MRPVPPPPDTQSRATGPSAEVGEAEYQNDGPPPTTSASTSGYSTNSSIFEPVPPDQASADRPPYTAWSPKGQRRLRFIRHALSMAEDADFQAVDGFLARNPSILRHLAYNTVSHPDWAFDDDDSTRSEEFSWQRRRRAPSGITEAEVRVADDGAVSRNLLLLHAISEVYWSSSIVHQVLAVIVTPTGINERAVRVGLRKRRGERAHVVSCTDLLDNDPMAALGERDRRKLAALIQRARPDSLLKYSYEPGAAGAGAGQDGGRGGGGHGGDHDDVSDMSDGSCSDDSEISVNWSS